MSLTLKVLLFNGQPVVDEKEKIFKDTGGTIGRSDACSLILADEKKIISRCHATIEFKNGQYQLIDNSLAGTFIDDDPTPISNTNVAITDGMHITIGDYTIICSFSNEISSSSPTDSLLNETENILETNKPALGTPFVEEYRQDRTENNALLNSTENTENSPFSINPQKNEISDNLLNESGNDSLLDPPDTVFGGEPIDSNNSLLDFETDKECLIDQGLTAENLSSLNDSFVPARVETEPVSEPEEMPADFDFFEDYFNKEEQNTEQEDRPQPSINEDLGNSNTSDSQPTLAYKDRSFSPLTSHEKVTSQSTGIDNAQLLQAFLSGAQVNEKDIDFKHPVEKMNRIGLMFRQFVDQTIAILRRRAEYKSLFRVSITTIKSTDNNPLKFAVTTDEAIKHLINDGQQGFKQSVDSIDEGFTDILNHQMAMQAGIQASLTEILKQFDPAVIEKQYEEGFVLNKKAKCWDKYNNIYSRLSETVVDDFFGEAFSDAYEKQMKSK